MGIMLGDILQKLTVVALGVFALACFRVGGGGPASAIASGKSGLELALVVQQGTAAGEPVQATIRLTNHGPGREKVNARLLLNHATSPDSVRDVSMDVAGPKGWQRSTSFAIRAGAPSASDFVTLEPGESVHKQYDLSSYYGLDAKGDYRLRATYLDVRTGKTVVSDEITLARR